MAKILTAFFSRADENYFGGSMRYIEIGNTEVVVGKIRELMLIRSYSELEEFCDHYGLDPSAVRKIY